MHGENQVKHFLNIWILVRYQLLWEIILYLHRIKVRVRNDPDLHQGQKWSIVRIRFY